MPDTRPDAASDSVGGATLQSVSDFALGMRAEDIPATTRKRASLLMLDTLAICAAAAPMEAGRIGRETAARLFAAGNDGDRARMLFDGRPVSLAGAVYAAATQTDNLDAHDGFNPAKGHVGVAVVPALAALTEAVPELSGPDALAALVVGYEIASRAGVALHGTVPDYHTSGAWNALGVAAMAVRLRCGDAECLRQALGIAEYHGPRSQMMREIATPTMLHDGSGWGGLAGITAAVLAEIGFTGAPAATVETDEVARYWKDLGRVWLTDQQYIKPYPTCRWGHGAVDAARTVLERNGVDPERIAEVRINTFAAGAALVSGMPRTTSEAQYSLSFAVAAMLATGKLGIGEITGPGLCDPRVAGLVAKTVVKVEPRHEARFPAGRWSDVELVMDDGRILVSGDVDASGGPDTQFNDDEIIAKYRMFAIPALGETRAEVMLTAGLALTDPGSRFADLAQHLYAPV
ncbi:MAG: MmgE/PrpD family protein [Silicimonas sp.]